MFIGVSAGIIYGISNRNRTPVRTSSSLSSQHNRGIDSGDSGTRQRSAISIKMLKGDIGSVVMALAD